MSDDKKYWICEKETYEAAVNGLYEYKNADERKKEIIYSIGLELISSLSNMSLLGHVTWRGHRRYVTQDSVFSIIADMISGNNESSWNIMRKKLEENNLFYALLAIGHGRRDGIFKDIFEKNIYNTEGVEDDYAEANASDN